MDAHRDLLAGCLADSLRRQTAVGQKLSPTDMKHRILLSVVIANHLQHTVIKQQQEDLPFVAIFFACAVNAFVNFFLRENRRILWTICVT